MKDYGIFYGSATGTTADVARRIAEKLGIDLADVHDVAKTSPDTMGKYNTLILGSSTWGDGDLEDDWYDFMAGASILDLRGHNIALFGCGDENMTDTFCNAVGEIYRRLKPTGASFIAPFDTAGYSFNHSEAIVNGKAVGLLLDEVNHPDLTDNRISLWVEKVKTPVTVA